LPNDQNTTYSNLINNHLGEVNAVYCSPNVPVNQSNFLYYLLNDLYVHRFDINQVNNISNSIYVGKSSSYTFLPKNTTILFDTMEIAYTSINIIDNQINYIINASTSNYNSGSLSNIYVALNVYVFLR
jgi:hypothetical protein